MGKPETKESKALKVKVSTKSVDGERTIVFVASSPKEDRDYESVDVKSLRLPLKGGGFVVAGTLTGGENIDIPMLLNHSFDVEDVIGSVRKAYLNESDELVFEAGVSSRFKAQDMLTLLEEDHLSNAFSITMIDYDYNFDSQTITNAEIAEVSMVFRGSNKEARLLAVKSLIKGDESMEKPDDLAEKKALLEKLQKEITEAEAIDITEAVVDEIKEEIKEEEAEVIAEADKNIKEESTEADIAEVKKEEKEMEKEIAKEEVIAKAAPVQGAKAEKQIDKYELASKQFVAYLNKDSKELSRLNEVAIKSFEGANSKETYMNATTSADGGAIVPSAEMLTDVYTTLANYSQVANDLRVITLTSGDSLDVATLVTDVIMKEVATEGAKKTATKPVFGDSDVTLREFAGVAVVTKKLVRQAAVNVYNILVESFARAIATKRAEMALTDATSGIINKSGVTELEADTAGVANYSWKDIKKMPYQIAAGAVQGGKYYISRELLETLDTETDLDGKDLDILTLNGDGLSGRFKNGFNFVVEETLGDASAHAVFGAMGRFGILLRQAGVESETFNTGIVTDGSEVSHNLLQENKLAERVAFYENVGYPIPAAFCVLVDAIVS